MREWGDSAKRPLISNPSYIMFPLLSLYFSLSHPNPSAHRGRDPPGQEALLAVQLRPLSWGTICALAQVKNLAWLATEERLLTLELAMLEDHGLTLPPETQPSAGLLGRKGQINWRWTALSDTRRALARRKRLRWVRRILTLGLWWK